MAIEVEGYYKRQAKELIDLLFDKRFLADDLSRESINWLEDYIGFILQSRCDLAARTALLSKKARDGKSKDIDGG